ncbi:chemotaxis protein CheA [Brevundimonas sp.]|jgi:two-component system chemotaxis sensor kinase CheA|uniref:chemotaxis protein CheA n=1 Tax=Brevundimonas sp. TaxID=1871086 RepID=UPI00391992BE
MTDGVDPFEAIKATFFQECDELLADLEGGLLAIESGSGDTETVNAVFRAVHSIKGGAGAFGLDELVRFAHVFETLLDEIRAGTKPADDPTVKTLLRAADLLSDHVSAARGDGERVDEERSNGLVAELEALTHGETVPGGDADRGGADDEDDFGFSPIAFSGLDAPALPPTVEAAPGWIVQFKPAGRMYAHANETALLLRELGRLGTLGVTIDVSELPSLDALDPETGYLTWRCELETTVDEKSVREVFDFVETDCPVTIAPLGPAGRATVDPPPAAAPADLDIAALLAAARSAAEPAPTVRPSPATPVAAPAPVLAKTVVPAAPAQSQSAQTVTIRVDLDRVDRLINVVGELVIQQAMLSQRVSESGVGRSSGVAAGLEDLELLTRDIQDSVMAIRAQPVKSVFQRMPRLVREVAEMTGKRVRLVTAGEDTEVDKTVVERLAEPITHMIRNAVDHGLETPEARVAAGKPEEGTVRLAALHRSGRIVIEISDDGKGINRERVRSIAVSKGLIPEDAALTDDEVDNLIFLPGFSTADAVSDISGRGVGMDVVKRSIHSLGGRISIASTPGKGSTFTLSLPLTLAVLDGMVVTAAEQTLVAPLPAIVESLTPRAEDVQYVGGHDPVIMFRETFVPLIDVALALGYRTDPMVPSEGVAVVVETEAGARAALLFDAIQGQRQVVIKSLETNYQQIEGVAAATILGDGRVALILDIDAIVTSARRRPNRPEFKLAS